MERSAGTSIPCPLYGRARSHGSTAMPKVPDSSAPPVINIQVTTEMGGDMDKRMSKNPNVNMDEVRRTDWKTARQ